ncbi:MAG: DUF3598 family protein [Coleofasciculus sp. C1-SOL-03]|uniref:hypothetical protein n=1 Tax=Coleofasciculus sp. C1-SOL-03 TaxID=3069522 RepID=UPI0032FB15F2
MNLQEQHWDKLFGNLTTEGSNSFPDTPEEPRVTQLLGSWQGTQQSMTADLNQSDPKPINELVLDPTQGKNQTFCLPDGVVVNSPPQLKLGEEFEIVAGKLVTANQYKRLTAKYDSSGAFVQLVLEVFHRQFETA